MMAEKAAHRPGRPGRFFAAARNSPLSRLLSLVLAGLFAWASAGEVCHGWSSAAADRAACCARMEHTCATLSADDCCEQGEQRQNREVPSTLPHPAPDMTAGSLLMPVAVGGDRPVARVPGARHRAHLLHSVFLI